jgi:hypothetical protein
MNDQRFNTYFGLIVGIGTAVVVSFVAALLESKAGEVATALATVISGSFVVGAAVIAWRSVQQQIASQESIEKTRRQLEIEVLEIGFTSELLVYSHGVIQALSLWNQRAATNPNDRVTTNFPVYMDPLYYRTNIGKVGGVRKKWVVGAIIGFYTNLLEMNEQSKESMAGRPTVNATSASVVARLRVMAANISQALDGLNDDRKFPLTQELRLDQLFMPNGRVVSQAENVPQNLQDVLLRMADIVATPV